MEEVRQLTEHAVASRERGDLEAAARDLQKALQKAPDDFQARREMAEVDWRQGRPDAAVEGLQAAREINPDSVAVHLRLGEIELGRHRYQTALAHVDEALELDPANAEIYCLRGEALEALGRRDEALASYYRGLAFVARDSRALLGVSRIQLAEGKPRRSLVQLRTLIRSDATPEERHAARLLTAEALVQLERWAEAASVMDQVIADHGGSADDYYRLAYAQVGAGEAQEARQTLGEVFRRDPKHAGAQALQDRLASTQPDAVASANQRKFLKD
jgi:tetratricopeptide (TPR) repeat protein